MEQLLHKRVFADIPIFYFDEVDSTQERAKSWLNDEAVSSGIQNSSTSSSGLTGVFVANHQNKGKGRRGRVWESKVGSSLLCSYILKPGDKKLWQIVSKMNLATCDVLNEHGANVSLKWPNDLMFESGKKLGGCLTEIFNDYLIVGIGLNLNNASFPQDLENVAGSLEDIGIKINRDDFINSVLAKYHEFAKKMGPDELVAKYKDNSFTLGKQVKIEQLNQTFYGLAVDITNDGSLLVRGEDGKENSFLEGDVEHLYFLND